MVKFGNMKGDLEDMGMLKSIGLENYKCFEKMIVDGKEGLEIVPLTILCGVNSSGKSSILKSLLVLKQSFEENMVSNSLLLNGKYIDNGTFSEILFNESTEKTFTISNEFQINNKGKFSKDKTSYRDLCRVYYNTNLHNFLINYSVKITNGGDSLYSNRIQEINIKIITSYSSQKIISNINFTRINKNVYKILGRNIPDVSGQLDDFDIKRAICYFNGIVLNSVYEEGMSSHTKLFIPAIISIFSIIKLQYSQLQYIAPLRETPRRRYIADKEVNNVGVSGENTPLLLKRIAKNKCYGIFAPLSDDEFNLSDNDIIKNDEYSAFINSWMNYINLGKISLDNRQKDLIKVKIGQQNIADVGFGVSQVLPILTEGLYLSPNQTLLLEQPEIHLHPKMQMRIADFLLSLCIQNKSIIVETHSDHFINRIVRRYMEDEKIRSKIKIYFIDKNSNGISNIESVNIDEVEGAVCSNENFFYQFANETAKIVDIGYKNLQRRNGEIVD